jgi:prepilin-type processing-associated H-X9-DG protein
MVELMVVIAIIGVLVALLVGGLGPAIIMAQNVECQNNLRQIAAAVINYTTDYRGAIPPTKYTGSSGLYWCNFLVRGSYLNADDSHSMAFNVPSPRNNVLRCPAEDNLIVKETDGVSLPADKFSNEDKAQGVARLGSSSFQIDCSYYWNGYAGNASGVADTWTPRFPSVVVSPTANVSDKAKVTHDISEVRYRTQTAMVMDGVLFDARTKANRGRIAARHSGTLGEHSATNIAFYDGHVGTIERAAGDDKKYAKDTIMTAQDLDGEVGNSDCPVMFLLPLR